MPIRAPAPEDLVNRVNCKIDIHVLSHPHLKRTDGRPVHPTLMLQHPQEDWHVSGDFRQRASMAPSHAAWQSDSSSSIQHGVGSNTMQNGICGRQSGVQDASKLRQCVRNLAPFGPRLRGTPYTVHQAEPQRVLIQTDNVLLCLAFM